MNPKKYWSCAWIFWWNLDQLCCYYWERKRECLRGVSRLPPLTWVWWRFVGEIPDYVVAMGLEIW